LRRAEGGAKIFGVFRVKNRGFTPKNHIFSNYGNHYTTDAVALITWVDDIPTTMRLFNTMKMKQRECNKKSNKIQEMFIKSFSTRELKEHVVTDELVVY
jgi:hypothetical protein